MWGIGGRDQNNVEPLAGTSVSNDLREERCTKKLDTCPIHHPGKGSQASLATWKSSALLAVSSECAIHYTRHLQIKYLLEIGIGDEDVNIVSLIPRATDRPRELV